MALSKAVAQRLVYKAHTVTGTTMTPGTEIVLATDPAATGGQELRRVTSNLNLVKSSFTSQEVAAHMQVGYLAHGGKRVTGNISGELSPKTYQDFMAAVLRGSWGAAVAKSNTEFTSVQATGSTFVVGGSTWAAQGYMVGDVIRFTNLSETLNNSRNFLITALSTTTATVSPAPTTMGADSAFNVTSVGRKVFTPATAQTANLFAIEHYWSDIDLALVFSECAIGSMGISMPAEGIASVDFGVLGRGMTQYATGTSPFFTAPTAALTTAPLNTIGGRVTLQGTTLGLVTGARLNCDIGLSAPTVAFQSFVPALYTGREMVSGELSLLLEDFTALAYFTAETECEVNLVLTDDSSDSADFISFFMPRVKFSAANIGSAVEGGVPITMPFQAIYKTAATGYDGGTLVVRDSLSA